MKNINLHLKVGLFGERVILNYTYQYYHWVNYTSTKTLIIDINSNNMINVIGSIDNASIFNSTYYLIFTDQEIYQFMTMSARERRSDLLQRQLSNPTYMIPVTNYKATQNEVSTLVMENIRRGKEIVENLESKIKGAPSNYTVIPYSTVEEAELSSGNLFSLPHLLLHLNGKKINFHLVHNNFKGRGKLADATFSEYENILRTAFGSKLIVKN